MNEVPAFLNFCYGTQNATEAYMFIQSLHGWLIEWYPTLRLIYGLWHVTVYLWLAKQYIQ